MTSNETSLGIPVNQASPLAQEVTGQSVFWAIIALALNAVSQTSVLETIGSQPADASVLPISLGRSSPIISLLDAMTEGVMLTMLVTQKLRRYYIKETPPVRDLPTQTEPVTSANLPLDENHAGQTHSMVPNQATPIARTIILLKLALFFLGVLPQAIKLFAMQGVPGVQSCAAVFLLASVTNALAVAYQDLLRDQSRMFANSPDAIYGRSVFLFAGHAAGYLCIWHCIMDRVPTPDTNFVTYVVIVSSFISAANSILNSIAAVLWVGGPFFISASNRTWRSVCTAGSFGIISFFLQAPESILRPEAKNIRRLQVPFPHVLDLNWEVSRALPGAVASAIGAFFIAGFFRLCADWILKKMSPQPLPLAQDHSSDIQQNASGAANLGYRQRRIVAPVILGDIQYAPGNSEREITRPPWRQSEMERSMQQFQNLQEQPSPSNDPIASLELISKVANDLRTRARALYRSFSRTTRQRSEALDDPIVIGILPYARKLCSAIIKLLFLFSLYLILALVTFMNPLPIFYTLTKLFRRVATRSQPDTLWLAFAICNLMTAAVYFLVAFDGSGTINPPWTSILG